MRFSVRSKLGPLFLGALLLSLPARAQTPSAPSDEVERLRRELQSVKQEYTDRLAALEERLKSLEAAQQAASPPPPAPAAAPPATSSKIFNPDIAAIGDFLGVLGKTPGGGEPSLQMHESELSFQAIVDPYARADFFLTFGPEEVGVEEGFVTFPTLPGGLLMKVGKMRDAFGKVNGMHNHVLPWTDRPLVTNNLLGGEDGLADAGISLSRLIPNRVMFLEATAQVYRGGSEVFKGPTRGDLAYVGHLRGYRDITESTNVDFGGSLAYGHNGVTADSTTRLFGVDAAFRYRPLRRAIYKRLIGRSELVWSRRKDPELHTAFGGYGSLEYQFGRRWFAGARFDASARATAGSITDKGGSLLLTYWPSEFSQVRAQYRHTRFGDGQKTANELLFQFLFAIGAHGAHVF